MADPADPTFRDLEHSGWSSRAAAYDQWFASITGQIEGPLLDAVGPDLRGRRLLDICCGPGHLCAAGTRAGAEAEGLDFADPMVLRARANHPGIEFRSGDAEALPYPDDHFDAAVCAFGLLHLADADRALREARRVLRSGGPYAASVWMGPGPAGQFFSILLGAIEKHGTLDVGLPAAPPMFRFADPDESRRAFTEAGFVDVRSEVVKAVWHPDSADDVFTLIYEGIVRAPMMLERQTDHARARIHEAIRESVEATRRDGVLEIVFPAAVIAATCP